MISIATLGMFLPCREVNNEHEKHRMIIRVKSLNSIDKEETPLKIILKCSDNLRD